MAAERLITDEARAMIGVESDPVTGYPVMEHEIRRYAYAVDDLNPLWLDAEYASKTKWGGIIAPPLCYNMSFATDYPLSELREDGVPKGGGSRLSPPLRATRSLAGGTDVEFFQPVRPGDILTSKSRLEDIYEREGRSGRLAFTVTSTTYTNQRGEVVCVVKSTSIAR
ncbi:MAG: MaoC family dehydratase N-terminal domain-containing protein [Chloroflexota bacterium]